ncbi:phosphatidate cytidylyltransferase [Stenoxybacter acetivorans]|uniref:phosphatidate cytidylyltransferase n=1 Tax=Stenoxybacter acetivorans TaxID=422441 RepID=UPI000560E47A|nr:phosphatidate cytidylyltransferase [Stenoxybacter acetivorans]
MLKQRILTALVLLLLMLGMFFYTDGLVWAVFCGLIALLTLWEYARLCGMSARHNAIYLAVSTVVLLMLWFSRLLPDALFFGIVSTCGVIILIFWLLVVPLWLKCKWRLQANVWAWLVGWLLVLPFWSALVLLHSERKELLLGAMVLVWLTDIGAYFVGRAFGKHKLAPVISPKKSWEGAVGGVVCALLFSWWVHAQYLSDLPLILILLTALLLAVVSILGDLLESWLKRAADVKDSSHLLPGHGGVFDRVDSLLAVLGVLLALPLTVFFLYLFKIPPFFS